MPNWIKLATGWALAALTAIAFSWGAVAQVRNRVIEPSVEIPTTAFVAATASQFQSGSTTSVPQIIHVEPEVVGDTSPTTATTDDGSAVTESGSTTSSTTTTTPITTTTQPPTTSTTTTTQPSNTTTTTTTTTTEPPQTETASYQLVGGSVTISYSPGAVSLVSAIPQPGFSTDVKHAGPDEVRIRFESDDHASDFRAEWEDAELKISESENAKG